MAHTGDSVLILDFGSQYTQLIARRVRWSMASMPMKRRAGRMVRLEQKLRMWIDYRPSRYSFSIWGTSVTTAFAPLLRASS
jgi:hypothetical protein